MIDDDLSDVDEEELLDKGPDRDTWCTPRELARQLGEFDLDPCSNPRSHIAAKRRFSLEGGQDGLKLARYIGRYQSVYINPPYSDVLPWIIAYRHTRFCFLLKFDTSTKWFARIHPHVELFALPKLTRIEFEPPPGVDGSSNQFPHALFYARRADATPAILSSCYLLRPDDIVLP